MKTLSSSQLQENLSVRLDFTVFKYSNKKKRFLTSLSICLILLLVSNFLIAQYPLPPTVPIWDGNTVNLGAKKIADGVYAIIPVSAENETALGIPQGTCGGFVVGEKGVLLIEVMLNKRLYEQEINLVKSITNKPIIYAVNTSDHGDHCFSNYLLPSNTVIFQNEFCKENLGKNFEGIKQFMIMLFGKDRGIEEAQYRAADITVAKNNNLTLDLGAGMKVEFINAGTAQSPADLFVWVPSVKAFWGGNPFIAESPAIPWLFDGYFLEPAANLKKMYDFLPEDAIVIPGHGRITNKSGIKYTIEYVETLKRSVEESVNKGLTLEQTKSAVTMKEFNKGYFIYDWLHYNFNLPNAYKDISANKSREK